MSPASSKPAVFLMALFVMLISTLIYPLNACAAQLEPQGTLARKAQRGFLNIVLAPLELENEMTKARQEDSAIPNWFIGGARGICAMAGRAVIGAYELATFPVPFPANYEPVIYPEFAWEHLQDSR